MFSQLNARAVAQDGVWRLVTAVVSHWMVFGDWTQFSQLRAFRHVLPARTGNMPRLVQLTIDLVHAMCGPGVFNNCGIRGSQMPMVKIYEHCPGFELAFRELVKFFLDMLLPS